MERVLLTSSSAAQRLQAATAWLQAQRPDAEVLLVGMSAESVGELARAATPRGGATFGRHRMSLRRLTLRLAERTLAARELSPASSLAVEAVWTRVVHRLAAAGKLGRFAPVAAQPGLPRALARTVDELRMTGLTADALDPDLATAARAFEAALSEAGLADRALVLRAAAEALEQGPHPLCGLPTLLLDLEVNAQLESDLLKALAQRASSVLAVVPAADDRSLGWLEAALSTRRTREEPPATSGLTRLQQNLFGAQPPALDAPAADVELLSAPGEMRECMELARHLHREAARGVPFDRMAVLLRAQGEYRSAIAEALRRAGIPAYFARGTRQPDPAGRALLALLACAEEDLSAQPFAEYLSLGEVPPASPEGAPPPAPPPGASWVPPDVDDAELARDQDAPEDEPLPEPADESEDAPVVAGTLRAPRRWEQLIVDAAVIGGDTARWRRRLLGLKEQFKLERSAPDVSEGNAARLSKALADLDAFAAYALPLLDLLQSLPKSAPWSTWLARIAELASRALRHPERVLSVLAELSPLSAVGPVRLAEVRTVLSERLLQLTLRPPRRRFGRVFVGPVDAARGMDFEVVLIPGLAERLFPQKVREDPLAPDAQRQRLHPGLALDADRVAAERLQLQLAVGAAGRQVVLSYPRIDSSDGRPRVPSFYALEALRAVEGRLPRYEELRRRAERAVDARIGWPAPRDPATAIDVAERDLSVLDTLFRGAAPPPRGAARYLTQVNPFLARALRTRYARWRPAWTPADGLVKPSAEALAALAAHQLEARAFSATALQHFAACPYRFFLSAILKLSPREEPAPLEELDPLQKGSIVHEVHYGLLSALRDEGRLPLTQDGLAHALARLDEIVAEVAAAHEDTYAPAIDRVWRDGLVAISADARAWLRQTVDAAHQWAPWKFELAFGLGQRAQQDPESRSEAMALDGGLRLRGSIDLVERSPSGALRATDYKTGKARAQAGTVLGGGKTLQPVLYSLALEKLFPGANVEGGRLYYCTQAGEFSEVFIPLDATTREAAQDALKIVGQALQKGFLPAAPAKDECTWCDYRAICGTQEQRRVAVKPKGELAPLARLREMK